MCAVNILAIFTFFCNLALCVKDKEIICQTDTKVCFLNIVPFTRHCTEYPERYAVKI